MSSNDTDTVIEINTKKESNNTEKESNNTEKESNKERAAKKAKNRIRHRNSASDVNGWNTNIENLVKQYADHAKCHTWMHNKAYKKYNNIATTWSVVNMVLLLAIGTTQFAEISCQSDIQWNIISGLITYCVSASIGVFDFLNYKSVSKMHKKYATKHMEVYLNIQSEVVKTRKIRTNGIKFMDSIKKTIKTLMEESPNIPNKIQESYINEVKNTNIHIPDITTNLQDFEININNDLKDILYDTPSYRRNTYTSLEIESPVNTSPVNTSTVNTSPVNTSPVNTSTINTSTVNTLPVNTLPVSGPLFPQHNNQLVAVKRNTRRSSKLSTLQKKQNDSTTVSGGMSKENTPVGTTVVPLHFVSPDYPIISPINNMFIQTKDSTKRRKNESNSSTSPNDSTSPNNSITPNDNDSPKSIKVDSPKSINVDSPKSIKVDSPKTRDILKNSNPNNRKKRNKDFDRLSQYHINRYFND